MTVGEYLRKEREDRGMSLRDVENALREIEGATKISSGHLSLIEQGKVSMPEPKTLHSLAKAMDLDYIDLMVEAGYLDKSVLEERPEAPALAFRGAERLDDEEKKQVQAIIDLLAQRKRSGRSGSQ